MVNLQLNLNKLKSFNEVTILEGLFLLEFLSSLKSSITYYKKMYQEVNVQVSARLRDYYIFYFLFILKIFYFPVLLRRNESVISNFDQFANYSLTLTNINMLPFIPDIFFKWTTPINCFFNLVLPIKKQSQLFLKYWNFPV